MSADADQHVFVSYVREDSGTVDGLCKILGAAGIPYWRDRKDLAPGDAWKAKIREAIQGGSLVFLACFSDRSRAREKSHMNEELTIAVEEFRKMPPGRTWLIPVRFDAGDIPEWDLGAGRMLSDLNYADLFGEDYGPEVASLVTVIGKVLGGGSASAAAEMSLAAVAQALDEQRVKLLQQLTKEMLPDPARRIQLSDQIAGEVRRVMDALADTSQFPTVLAGTTDLEQIECLVEHAERYWRVVQPFCASLQVAARWAEPAQLEPWTSGLRVIAANAAKIQGGHTAMIDLAHMPMIGAAYTVAIACTASRNWANLRVLLVDATIRDPNTRDARLPLVDVSSLWSPFQHIELGASVFARSTVTGESVSDAFDHYTVKKQGKYYTPVAEWAHTALRSLFADQLPSDDDFASEFDRAEVMLGVLSQDEQIQRQAAKGPNAFSARSRWFGRATWRSSNGHGNPVAEMSGELDRDKASWPPLGAGLFGGDPDRARAAVDGYAQDFGEISRRRW